MLDNIDFAILEKRQAAFTARTDPKQGDFVRFADGTLRRISHVWTDAHDKPESIQTSDGGSFYFGNGYMSFSGALYVGIPANTLTRTAETRLGSAWFFHHDFHFANNGIQVQVQCAVWECSMPAPTY